VLNGGDGDDILVGGTTAYDSDAPGTKLRSIMLEWASGNSYDIRRRHILRTLGGGLNGAYKLSNATVQNDADADTLTGGAGTDWFWSLGNEITDWSIFNEKIGAN